MEKKYRLQKNKEFQRVFRAGKSFANRQLVLYYSFNPEIDHFRLGISVSKKIGHAVVRNQIKRRLKEIGRSLNIHITPGVDLILIVRKPAIDLDYEELKRSVVHLLKKAKLYQ